MGADKRFSEIIGKMMEGMVSTVMDYKDEQADLADQLKGEIDKFRWELEKAKETEDYLNGEIAKLKEENEKLQEKVSNATKESAMYRKWWYDENLQVNKLSEELSQYKEKATPENQSEIA